jgi:hypothetical protein
MSLHAPSRFLVDSAVRRRFGERVDRLGPRFFDGDPLGDEAFASLRALPAPERNVQVDRALRQGADGAKDAPEPLRALLRACEVVPFWVDFPRVSRGGAVFLRSGLVGGMILGTYALTASYCSPAGNKPLLFSGRLEEQTPRRLAETGRFVQLVAQRETLRPGNEGWRAAVKVRLMHAAVRSFCLASPRWNREAWGTPINQPDMAGTGLLFSWVVLDGLDKLGLGPRGPEREDLLHQWRYVSWLLGVDQDLLWTSEVEARDYWELLVATQGGPDEDSKRLATALLDSGPRGARTPEERARAERILPVSHALSRYFLGDAIADQLGLRKNLLGKAALPALSRLQAGSRMLARTVPMLSAGSAERGARYWQFIVDQGLRGTPADFAIPEGIRAG